MELDLYLPDGSPVKMQYVDMKADPLVIHAGKDQNGKSVVRWVENRLHLFQVTLPKHIDLDKTHRFVIKQSKLYWNVYVIEYSDAFVIEEDSRHYVHVALEFTDRRSTF